MTWIDRVRVVCPEAVAATVSRQHDYTAGGMSTVITVLLAKGTSVDRAVDVHDAVCQAVDLGGLKDFALRFDWEKA